MGLQGVQSTTSPVPVLLFVYQRGSLLDGLAMYLSCDTKKFHDNESTHILHNFWTSTHRGGSFPLLPPPLAAPLAVGIVASVPCIDNPDTHAFSGMEMVPSIQLPSVRYTGSKTVPTTSTVLTGVQPAQVDVYNCHKTVVCREHYYIFCHIAFCRIWFTLLYEFWSVCDVVLYWLISCSDYWPSLSHVK